MNQSLKFLLASVSPAALAAGWAVLDAAPANATVTVATSLVNYATENFIGASGASTVIIGSNFVRVSSANSTTTDFGIGSITFTLSNGATFAAAPSPTGTTNLTLGTGSLVSGSTAVTYAVTSVGSTTAASITLGNFQLNNVGTRMATSGQTITIAYGSAIGSNTPATASGTLAVSAHAYRFTSSSVGNSVTIDLANSGSGLLFRSGSSNVAFATLGMLNLGIATRTDISGSTTFTAGASDILRATVTGNLSAFSSVYATIAACAATAPPGAISGTIAADARSATLSPLTINANYNFCAVANGTSFIPSGSITGSMAHAFVPRTVAGETYTPSSAPGLTATLATLSYNGSAGTAFYALGGGAYASAIRLTNPSGNSGSVFVQVTPDTTGVRLQALLDSTLAAGQSKFYFSSDIRAAVGTSVLTNSDNRATVVFLTTFSGLRLQNFMLNPGGVITGGTSVGQTYTDSSGN